MKRLTALLILMLLLFSEQSCLAAVTAIQPGNVIIFGRFEQDNNLMNGPEELQWIVADVTDGQALLISKYVIDQKGFDPGKWNDGMRKWLNGAFKNAAFSTVEQKAMVKNNHGGKEGCIFIPSQNELELVGWMCKATSYAKSRGYYETYFIGEDEGYADMGSIVAQIYQNSSGAYFGYDNVSKDGVRPALKIDVTQYYTLPVGGTNVTNWDCTCGRTKRNTGRYCTKCGRAREDGQVVVYYASDYKKTGNYVYFGRYEQDNNRANGKEPIEWLVLNVVGNQALLLSRFGLDVRLYNKSENNYTWQDSDMRSWLNDTFLDQAFHAGEWAAIVNTVVDNGGNQNHPRYTRNGGKDTIDKVFLLSYAQAERYLKTSVLLAQPTIYAINRGAIVNADWRTTQWFLRSPGKKNEQCFVETHVGNIDAYASHTIKKNNCCIRPCIWVDLTSGIFQ